MQELQYKLIDDGSCCVSSYTGDEALVTVPETVDGLPVTVISDGVFQGHPEITEIHLPDTLTDLGEFVFDGCENLRSLKLPPRLERFWGYTFVRCGLEHLELPDRIRSIPPFCFKDCRNLKRVVCGAGLKKICAWAFDGCPQLEELICGHPVNIHPQAFEHKELNS